MAETGGHDRRGRREETVDAGKHVAGPAADHAAITRGEDGISLFYDGGGSDHVPTEVRAVADATGAGDTAIATLALARLAGASWVEAAEMANTAAGVVVEVLGTAALGPEDLERALARIRAKEDP